MYSLYMYYTSLFSSLFFSQSLYLSYIRNSRYTTVSSLPHIRFMCGCLVEFLSLSPDHAHQLVFVYTRQLANQLRSAYSNNTVAVATWPFMHSLELFSAVLSSPRCDKSLFPLIYPVTMVAMGVAQFLSSSSAAFVPARLHIVRMLLEVATETNTYIPLAPILLEVNVMGLELFLLFLDIGELLFW